MFKDLAQSFTNLTQIKWGENFGEIIKNPVSILALLGLLVLVLVLVKAKKIKFTPRLMSRVALLVALSVVLDFFKLYRFPQGGSITLGGMVPLLLVALWYGPEVGFLAGLLFGVVSLILGPYIVHPIQVLFDYPLPFLMLGTAGFFKKNKYVAAVIAVALRFICHVISGVVFFASYAPPGQSPLVYSMVYNGSYLVPELIICVIILAILPVERLYKTVMAGNN